MACASCRTVHSDRQLCSWDAVAKIAPGLGADLGVVLFALSFPAHAGGLLIHGKSSTSCKER